MNSNDRAWKDKLTSWGQQTVLYAMGEKSRRLGRELDPAVAPNRATMAMNEAFNIASLDIWSKAIAASGGEYKPSTGSIYTGLILEWVAKHLGYKRDDGLPQHPADEAK